MLSSMLLSYFPYRRRYRVSLDSGMPSDAETMHDAHVPFIVVNIHRPLYCSGAR